MAASAALAKWTPLGIATAPTTAKPAAAVAVVAAARTRRARSPRAAIQTAMPATAQAVAAWTTARIAVAARTPAVPGIIRAIIPAPARPAPAPLPAAVCPPARPARRAHVTTLTIPVTIAAFAQARGSARAAPRAPFARATDLSSYPVSMVSATIITGLATAIIVTAKLIITTAVIV